ncbi:MAG: UDP-N-acetylmuramoyl-L-alanine--D-glutamate ligase [Sulfurimicrobium sp.]|jgi:UDP-N-acetylmuramoylalanine--D-glutamate ligase|nr:UDP-N-acetylmuramoyl-L-alanine--D-glutamate ligase [Sulfurimicrobium sp.]MDP2197965.1 UDP-N-acetylmuramoyl-L-alanine--D-glutamate ligase [Sulfurimicrobium sp.]MDP2961432.1 UDP-N-acetylmuramoyl-L-alanine--D-glutamate ligase [Sulfurimicrobium sp.]MDP3689119.1 UDP-N-acetylmuramoyl-L-alanine--D-glutamate ligase [Sulfurimicrobium sp.]MDZ7656484.1 UDP-N-acetylmuramoyl-L-alanine--D-glutamate ligase [Sulfurimicrobium sp.]
MLQLVNRNVLVLGLGDTGLSLVRFLLRHGARVTVADSREAPPHATRFHAEFPTTPLHTGPFSDTLFTGIDLIAISPGVPLADPKVAAAVARGVPVAGDVELFAIALGTAAKVLAITGSNGKSTVTEMTGAMCRAAGLKTTVAGNIGLPVLDALIEAEQSGMPEVFVLELSSFQLETTSSLNASAAIVLNISEDHLDRYIDMDHYSIAKTRVFNGSGIQILNRDDARTMDMALPGRKIETFGLDAPANENDWGVVKQGKQQWLAQGTKQLMPLSELPLAGLHNAANALAALALCRAIGLPFEPLLDALRHFKGLPHRVEKVAEINGVTFYDDSKGTNVGATVAALAGMPCKVVLIAGGDGKGQDFSPLAPAVALHARAVVLIGRDGARIGAVLENSGVPLLRAGSMEEAAQFSMQQAQPGDAVLLSPACASYDMFRNYIHRAEAFISAVKQLGRGDAS